MTVGRRRSEPERGPEQGAGISIGGSNSAPLQHVVGQNISNVHQSASVEGGAVDLASVRDTLEAFRTALDQNRADMPHAQTIRSMTDTIDTSVAAVPDPQAVGALRGVAQTLPTLVAGTAVQQGGEALAHALTNWLG